jgi:hypothetical protein
MNKSFRLLSKAEIAAFSCRTPVVERVLAYWDSLRAGRQLPPRCDVDPIQLKLQLPHIMLVELTREPFRARYRLVGTEVVRFAHFDFTNRYADDLDFKDDDGTDWHECYRLVSEARAPGFGVAYWRVAGDAWRWIEFIICPLSNDGVTVNQCLSAEDYEPLNVIEIDSLRPVAPHI